MNHVAKYAVGPFVDEVFIRRLMKLSLDHVNETEFFLYEFDSNTPYSANSVKIKISFDRTITITRSGGGGPSAVRLMNTIQDGMKKRQDVTGKKLFDFKLVETDNGFNGTV